MTAPDSPAPPLPKLSGETANGSAPANDWRLLVESVPLYAETGIFVPTKTMLTAARSPLRTGTVRFTADGMTIEGMEPKPLPDWYSRFASFLGFFGAFGYMIFGVGEFTKIPGSVRGVGFAVGFVSSLVAPRLATWLLDRNRQEVVQIVPWSSLHSVQVDKKVRYVTLIYSVERITGPAKRLRFFPFRMEPIEVQTITVLEYLTLNRLEPSVVQGVTTTLAHFAPNVSQERVTPRHGFAWVTHWITLVALTVFGVIIVALLVAVLFIVWKRLRP